MLTLPPLSRCDIFAGGGLAEKALFCFPCTPYATDLPDVFNDGFVPELQSYPSTLWLLLQCPPTETVPTIRDGEPRTSVSTFTQLLTSELRGIGFIVA